VTPTAARAAGAGARYKQALAGHVGVPADRISLFWKGRVGLYAILKALGVGPGDEVVVPAFTCVVVPNVVMYLGATPVYADIDAATYNAEATGIERRISPRTKVILAQNTFGLAPDLDPILDLAQARGIRVIEDCAHGLGGTYKSRPNGTTADVSFFSTQWSKPISTGLGGFTVTTDPDLAAELQAIERGLADPTASDGLMLRVLLFARKRVLPRTGYWTAIRLYRALSKRNIVIGSSDRGEVQAPVMPGGFLKGLSAVQAEEGVAEVARIDAVIEHRRRVAASYREALGRLGVTVPLEPPYAKHTFLRFPLLTNDREAFVGRAMDEGIEVGDWFVSPLHPVTAGLDAWGYRWGENPVAEDTCRRIVNLPTHDGVDEHEAERVIDFVRRNRALVRPADR
jgi:perosamine synthetase